jgi:diguanylate cyclase (GGDEF)-like protein
MQRDPLRLRILIGEPDPHHCAHLRAAIADLGFAVEFCSDGTQFLRALRGPQAPYTALVDLGLSNFQPIEIRHALKAQPLEDSTWTIAMYSRQAGMTNTVPNEVAALALQGGFSDLIAKPVIPVELLMRLKTAERIRELKEKLKSSIDAVGFQASHDPLTGLWNREALLPLLFQETDRVRRTSSPLALLLIDIDHFMHRNLEFGYEVCDEILRQLAVRLRRQLRSYDVVGRTGEDEFLIALPGCSADDALAMAERLRVRVLHLPFHTRAGSVAIRASFGVAQSTGRSPLIVLREAEQALDSAKQAGRDRVRFFHRELLGHSSLPTSELGSRGNVSLTSRKMRLAVLPGRSAHKQDIES